VASDLKLSLAQEMADSQEVARLIAEGKKVTDPELQRRMRASRARLATGFRQARRRGVGRGSKLAAAACESS
jgi:hypothetical protein